MPVLYPQPAYGAFPESMIFSRQTKRGKLLQRAPSCPSDSRQIRQQDRRRETSLYTYRITAGTTKIGIFRFDTLSRHAAPPLPARQACVVPQAQVERPGVWVNTDKILELTPDPIHLRKIFCQTQPMNKVPIDGHLPGLSSHTSGSGEPGEQISMRYGMTTTTP